jgi:hypothetical protein
MVDDIHFPKGLPPVPPSGGIQKVNRKKGEKEKPPFENFLEQEDQKDKRKRKGAQKSDLAGIPGETEMLQENQAVRPSPSTASAEAEADIEKKIIDVRV